MRILRIRRGFTTNSSGTNEYLKPGAKPAGASPGPTTPTTVLRPPSTTPTTVAPAAPGDREAASTLSASSPATAPGPHCTPTGAMVLAWALIIAGAAIALARVVRLVARKMRSRRKA